MNTNLNNNPTNLKYLILDIMIMGVYIANNTLDIKAKIIIVCANIIGVLVGNIMNE